MFIGLSSLLGSGGALAQSAMVNPIAPKPLQPEGSGPAGLEVGPMMAYPGIDFAWGRDDNLFLTTGGRKESSIAIFSPYVKLEGKPTPHSFDFLARGDFGRYGASSADNYNDHMLAGNGKFVFTGSLDFSAHVEHVGGHDPRGSTDRVGGAEPDTYENTGFEGTLGYGGEGARGRIEVNAGNYKRDYTNNRAFTAASDRETAILGATFFVRVMPRTSLLFQMEQRDIDFQLPASTQDSQETRYYVGAKWEATAATTGYAKVGRLEKDFDSAARQDFDGTAWDLGVRWSPRTYSHLDLSTMRTTEESTGVGDSIDSKRYNLNWTHNWSSRFSTVLLGSLRNDKFQGVGVTREDDTTTHGAKVFYQFRRWMRVGLEWTHTERDSNTAGANYGKNLYLFTIGATL